MNDKACATLGKRLAARYFYYKHGTSAIRLSENELAAMLALAIQEGWTRGYNKRKIGK